MNCPSVNKIWKTSERTFQLSEKALVMGILNVTPDSFSDGGKFNSVDNALGQVEVFIDEGADIVDIGGESTRPGGKRITWEEEIQRVVPLIREIKARYDIPISIDTSKSEVAERAVEAGAEIINDVSGLRFDNRIAKISARHNTGLVLMHLLGEYETMHKRRPDGDILENVARGLEWSIESALEGGVKNECLCLDVGIGFSKTQNQNLELIAKLDDLSKRFSIYPLLVGTSRKSFIGKVLGEVATDQRLNGTIAANVISVWNGANIVRAHDVKPMVEALKLANALSRSR